MKVSFISGLYNCENYLEKCIESLLHQTYADFEIILINNASVDNTYSIANKYKELYKEKIILYNTEEKLGAGGSRQKGMEYATGEYICFIDCDDYVSNDYIERMIRCAELNNFPDIVISNFQKVDLHDNVKYIRTFNNEQQALVQSIAPWAKMYKKSYLEKNNLYFRNMKFGEDVIFSAEIYLTQPSVALECEGKGYFWLENPTSTSHTELRNFPEGVLKTSREYFGYMINKYPEQQEELCYFVVKYYLWYLLQSGRNVNSKLMREEYTKMFTFVDEIFPDWWKRKFILKEDRRIIKWAVKGSRILKKINLLKVFFMIYAKLPMEKLWPSL